MSESAGDGSGAAEAIDLPCREFSEFKSALQQARIIDDKIVYNLNTSVPTQSFAGEVSAKEQCMSLYKQLRAVHKERSRAITHCVDLNAKNVEDLKGKMTTLADSDPDMAPTRKKIGMQLRKLRLMQNELAVEEAVQERSMKVFRERCWKSYRPPEDI